MPAQAWLTHKTIATKLAPRNFLILGRTGGKLLEVSIDELVFGSVSERMEKNINDRELLNIFQKVQKLEPQQLFAVKDFVSAYLLKNDLQKNLSTK